MSLREIAKVTDTTEVTLRHPTTDAILTNADGSPMVVVIHGPYSKRYKNTAHEQTNRRLNKMNRTGGKMTMTAEEIEESTLDLMVACVESWNITVDTKPEPFSTAAVRKVFEEFPWLREQVESVMGDTRAFLAESKPS